jgi:tape measure domain-containing protein
MAGNILGALLLEIVTKANTSGLDKTDRSLKRTGKTLKNIHKEAGFLSKMTGKLMAGFSFYGIKNMFDSYLKFEKDLGSMRSRFYAITLDENKANEEFEFIRKQAKDLALDIKSTADSYSIFYSATRKALGEEGTRGVFENWTKVGRVLHLTTYQMERVTYALREMASKGAIYSQDLRMQIGTHVPNAMGLAQKAAEQMGVTGTDWFEKLQKMAKGNTKVTSEFVRLFSKEARKAYGGEEAFREAMKQPDALAQNIKNLRTEFGINVSNAGGKNFIVGILDGIYNLLQSMPLDGIANTLGNILGVVGDMAKYLPEIVTILRDIAVIYLGRMLSKGIAGLFSKISKSAFLINMKYIFRDGLKAGLLNIKTGFFNTLKYVSAHAMKIGLKAILGRAILRFIPFVGQALLFFDIVKMIWKVVQSKFGKEGRDKFFDAYGIPEQTLKRALLDAKNDTSIKDTDSLRRRIALNTGNEQLAKDVYYKQGDIYVNFKDTHIVAEDLDTPITNAVKGGQEGMSVLSNGYYAVPKNEREKMINKEWKKLGGK